MDNSSGTSYDMPCEPAKKIHRQIPKHHIETDREVIQKLFGLENYPHTLAHIEFLSATIGLPAVLSDAGHSPSEGTEDRERFTVAFKTKYIDSISDSISKNGELVVFLRHYIWSLLCDDYSHAYASQGWYSRKVGELTYFISIPGDDSTVSDFLD